MNGFLTSLLKEINRPDISEERRAALRAIYEMAPGEKTPLVSPTQKTVLREALASITAKLKSSSLSEKARSELIKYYHYVERMLDPTKENTPRQ